MLSNPTLILHGPTLVEYQVNCRDFTYYADSRLVSASYIGKSAGAILTDVINKSKTGLTPDPFMPSGPVITSIQFDHQTISDVADQLSNLASWQSDYAFWVGYDLVFHWQDEASATVAAITVFDDQVTGVPTTATAYIDLGQTFTYEWDGTTLRNQAVVRGASKTRTQTDNFSGDGNTKQWALAFDMDAGGNVTLTVGGVTQTIKVVTDTTAPTTQYQLYQQPTGQWFLLTGTASAPGAGVAMVLTYSAQIPITAQFTNGDSVAQYNGPNGGVFEVFIADESIKDATTAYARARSEVLQYDLAQERFTFSIVENWPGHIRTGYVFTLNSNWIPDSQNAWNVGFVDYFIVTRLRINGVVGGRRRYDITAVRVNLHA